jgi:hypothetical protein
MSIDETLETLLRKVVREELQVIAGDDRLLTAEQVADMLGYTDIHSVYRLKREGRLTAVYISDKAYRFRNSEVQKFIKELAA